MKCPFCAEEIKDEAIKCRFCGELIKKEPVKRDSGPMTLKLEKPLPGGKKILIIDDEPNIVLLVKTRLEMKRYKAIKAHDGEEGLLKARAEKPDLIIVDVMMPKMNGFGFVQAVKADEQLKNIPIIVFSAKDSMKDSFLAEGVQAFISKPYDPDTLLNKIQQLIGG